MFRLFFLCHFSDEQKFDACGCFGPSTGFVRQIAGARITILLGRLGRRGGDINPLHPVRGSQHWPSRKPQIITYILNPGEFQYLNAFPNLLITFPAPL